MTFLQTVIPIIFDNSTSSPSGPWTRSDTLLIISVNISFLIMYVIFALIDKFRGETWVDAFGFEQGLFLKIVFALFFWISILVEIICLLTYVIYQLSM